MVKIRPPHKSKQKNMKTEKLKLAIMAGALSLAIQARGSIDFSFNFTDSSGDVAAGNLFATPLGGNQYLATSGTINVIAAPLNPLVIGTYALLPGGPGPTYSPSGAFIFNNVLYYPGDPALDTYGVLGFRSIAGIELNIWGNSPDNYSFYAHTPAAGYILGNTGAGTFTLAPIPEPTTLISGALLLLPFGASTLRILRRNRAG
jgi:hypothetical protein